MTMTHIRPVYPVVKVVKVNSNTIGQSCDNCLIASCIKVYPVNAVGTDKEQKCFSFVRVRLAINKPYKGNKLVNSFSITRSALCKWLIVSLFIGAKDTCTKTFSLRFQYLAAIVE